MIRYVIENTKLNKFYTTKHGAVSFTTDLNSADLFHSYNTAENTRVTSYPGTSTTVNAMRLTIEPTSTGSYQVPSDMTLIAVGEVNLS